MQGSYLTNFSYLFVPFAVDVDEKEKFEKFHERITDENGWKSVAVENRYLHKYVLDKISRNGKGRSICYRLDADFAKRQDLALETEWYGLGPKEYKGESNVTFDFMISNVDLFVFSTSICILAFELRFQDDDPYKIAAAQYFLRKISTERIYRLGDTAGSPGEHFVDISERILRNAAQDVNLDFFFYATPNNEKANFLTYIDVPVRESYEKELFYLKWCYNDTFGYDDFTGTDDSENYRASDCTTWGLSVSAAVCLASRSEAQTNFIENVFQKNFRKHYLLTYVLLLHQKYMMYFFLTKVSCGLDGNLPQLEKYKAQLYDFETNYMFSYVSEVPQYQRFYKKVRELFVLDELFRDVQEPLTELTEMKKENAEKAQRANDDRINKALIGLSLLTIVSALTDATGITANLDWLISPVVAKTIQSVAVVAVVVGVILMLRRLFFPKKR